MCPKKARKIYVLEGRLSPKLFQAPSKTKLSGKSVIMGKKKYTLAAEYPSFAVYARGGGGVADVCDLPLADTVLMYPLVFVTYYTKDVDRNIKNDVIDIISGIIEPEPCAPPEPIPTPAPAENEEDDDDMDVDGESSDDDVEDEEDDTGEEPVVDEEDGDDEDGEDDEEDSGAQRVYSTRQRRRDDDLT